MRYIRVLKDPPKKGTLVNFALIGHPFIRKFMIERLEAEPFPMETYDPFWQFTNYFIEDMDKVPKDVLNNSGLILSLDTDKDDLPRNFAKVDCSFSRGKFISEMWELYSPSPELKRPEIDAPEYNPEVLKNWVEMIALATDPSDKNVSLSVVKDVIRSHQKYIHIKNDVQAKVQWSTLIQYYKQMSKPESSRVYPYKEERMATKLKRIRMSLNMMYSIVNKNAINLFLNIDI